MYMRICLRTDLHHYSIYDTHEYKLQSLCKVYFKLFYNDWLFPEFYKIKYECTFCSTEIVLLFWIRNFLIKEYYRWQGFLFKTYWFLLKIKPSMKNESFQKLMYWHVNNMIFLLVLKLWHVGKLYNSEWHKFTDRHSGSERFFDTLATEPKWNRYKPFTHKG
jgi:hypothetical protein